MTSPFPNLRDGFPDQHHLVHSEPIAPSKVTCGTRGLYVTSHMRFGVVNSIKTTIQMLGTAVNAWLLNKIKHFFCGEITLINPTISAAQKRSTTFWASSISKLSRSDFFFLFRAKVLPAISSIISTPFTFSMAGSALVSKAQGPRGIFYKDFRRSRKRLLAAVTSSGMYILHKIPKRVVGQ